MADIAITAASVVETANTAVDFGIAGATITAGQMLYKDSANSNVLKLTVITAQLSAQAVGMALGGAASGQRLRFATDGDVTINAVGATPWLYICSPNNPGGICLVTDAGFVATNWVTIVGTGPNSTTIRLGIRVSNSQK